MKKARTLMSLVLALCMVFTIIPVSAQAAECIVLGDANGDGSVNNVDAMVILQYAVGLKEPGDLNLAACNVDGGESVDNVDAMLILQFTVGLLEGFPAESVSAAGHDYIPGIVMAPTCTEKGIIKYECKKCGHSYTEEVNANDHSYIGTVTAPTCTEDGYITYTCACGQSYTEAIKATGHNHSSKVTAPTCTAKGYTTHTCGNCGHSYKDTETAALGHKWGDWVRTKEPTTSAEGEDTRTCTRSGCGKTETRAVEKLPEETEPPVADCTSHSWGNWTSDDNGSYGSCTNCGQSITIDGSTSNYAQEVVTIINEYRAAEKLEPITWFASKGMLVRAHELTVYFSHNRPDGSRGVGTCIAAGYGSAKAVVDGWMGSDSHRGSLMNPNATEASAAYNGSFWVLYIG